MDNLCRNNKERRHSSHRETTGILCCRTAIYLCHNIDNWCRFSTHMRHPLLIGRRSMCSWTNRPVLGNRDTAVWCLVNTLLVIHIPPRHPRHPKYNRFRRCGFVIVFHSFRKPESGFRFAPEHTGRRCIPTTRPTHKTRCRFGFWSRIDLCRQRCPVAQKDRRTLHLQKNYSCHLCRCIVLRARPDRRQHIGVFVGTLHSPYTV